MRRRNYLALAVSGGIGSIAGCSESDDQIEGEEATPTPNEDTPTEEETPTETDEGTSTEEETPTEEEAEPASFEIVEVDHPEEVETGEEHTFAVTVKNVGGETGTFEEVLEISVEGESGWENVGVVTLEDISPDETRTWETEPFDFSNGAVVQYRLADAEWSYEVTVTEPDPQSFAGSGQEVRDGVNIEGGLTVVEATHNGESNFQVKLAGEDEYDDLFINIIGDFDGAQADLIEAGEYILDVNADGSWEVTIRQPRASSGESRPVSYSGNGPEVVGPVAFDGTDVVEGTHDGESNFQVQIYPMEGSFGELVFNEIGSFEGQTTYSFSGLGWIDINADGNWTLEFEG